MTKKIHVTAAFLLAITVLFDEKPSFRIMKSIRPLIVAAFFCVTPFMLLAQDSLITALSSKYVTTFSIDNKTFSGEGWDLIIGEAQKSDFVLIGEDHFTNEIPFFASALTQKIKFDNYFCEVDPYSANILEAKLKTLSDSQLKSYVKDFGNVFSFFALDPEFQLLKQLVKSNTAIFGTDQVLMIADRLICSELKKSTKNAKAKQIYENIERNSKAFFDEFMKDYSKPMYMLTDAFENDIAALSQLDLSKEEKEKIEALKLSAKIYKEGNHHLRVQLMKNNLMRVYPKWENKKNLFKYGAIHTPAGESLLKIYDIGNLVNNIADSKYKKSLHIMVIERSGSVSSPFKGGPTREISENDEVIKSFKPFFKNMNTDKWHCFDMIPLRTEIETGKLVVNDIDLLRIIKGYDYVIIIPKVTPASFP